MSIGELHEQLFLSISSIIIEGKSINSIYDYIYFFFKSNSITEIPGTNAVSLNINNIVYHGVPRKGSFSSGDVVTVDVCFCYRREFIDGAKTFIVGSVSDRVKNLVLVSRDVILSVSKIIEAGTTVGSIIKFISDYVAIRGFYLFPHGMGHGIGKELHVSPILSLSNYSDWKIKLEVGDYFTIEPIIFLKEEDVIENILGEGYISDGNISSQFEVSMEVNNSGGVNILNRSLLN